MKTLSFFPVLLFAFCTASLLFSLASCSEQEDSDVVTSVESGKEIYIAYCAICHGEEGKGDGAYAELLRIPPSDLTQIKKKYNDNFPEGMLREIVAGQARVDGHGSDMPVWSEAFKNADDLNEEEVDAKIAQVVSYIRSLQEG